MIIKPGISSLEKCVADGCRYVLVTVAAKRARMLGEGSKKDSNILNKCLVQCDSENPVTQAISEISAGKVSYIPKDR